MSFDDHILTPEQYLNKLSAKILSAEKKLRWSKCLRPFSHGGLSWQKPKGESQWRIMAGDKPLIEQPFKERLKYEPKLNNFVKDVMLRSNKQRHSVPIHQGYVPMTHHLIKE